MDLIIISDSHGNLSFIETIFGIAKSYDLTIHLGDNYNDVDIFLENQLPIIRVPGTWGPEYQDPMIENRRYEIFNGWRFFLTHTPTKDYHDLKEDIDPESILKSQNCDIFCHGHTHQPMIRKVGDVIVLNPGHLKSLVDRGYAASYATLKLTDQLCKIQIINYEKQTVFQELVIHKDEV